MPSQIARCSVTRSCRASAPVSAARQSLVSEISVVNIRCRRWLPVEATRAVWNSRSNLPTASQSPAASAVSISAT